MMRRLFSSFGQQLCSVGHGWTAQLRKAPRRGKRHAGRARLGSYSAASCARLSLERMEPRLVLSATMPTLQMAPTTVATTDQSVTLNYLARFTDVIEHVQDDGFGNLLSVPSTYRYTIDWGDGSVPTMTDYPQNSTPVDAITAVPLQGVLGATVDGKIKGRHTYAVAGNYTVTLSLTEDDGVEVSAPVLGNFTISVRDPFVPLPGENSFELTEVAGLPSRSDPIAEGTPVNFGFAIPESVPASEVESWTISWGDQTVTYEDLPESVAHVYQDFLEQFASSSYGFDGFGGNSYYISGAGNAVGRSRGHVRSRDDSL